MAYDEVDSWLAHYDNPMRDVVQRVRLILLSADDRIEECIKWKTPTFTYKGNLASFFPNSRNHATLMFHHGALIPGKYPHLEGSGKAGRVMKIASIAEAEEYREEICDIVAAWIAWRDAAEQAKAAS
ncbi:DUF1801 domain-containing protein [Demequina zhanjiangensis]|uniref:DUF1801 domain-containing protein n=1 Tax=Demequina zhanjiangensis TaxID=3051659 RepID=A0ABT8FYA7_9MICO|nr:DUF1801 domain-containing protein [Demequina sp. SYSU T00b26]MDN4471885.1 DUF1801 domain-containing protein [Demequina sp. SYSU T00b26]